MPSKGSMTDVQRFLFWDALRRRREDFARRGLNTLQAADELTREVGFRVSRQKVSKALREGVAEPWAGLRVGRPRGAKLLALKIQELRDELDAHRKECEARFLELGRLASQGARVYG